MDSVLDLCLLGLSHRTAPVAVREQYAVKPEDLASCLRDLAADESVKEVCVFSTCNRTEVLVRPKPGRDPLEAVKRRVFRNLPEEYLYEFQGVHAIIHLFRVASGLDSLVVGESEVLAQVRRGFETARETGTSGEILQALFTHSTLVGKRVRNETEIGQGTLSVARVGVDIARHVYGGFERCRALVVGAGETGLLVARNFASHGMAEIDFANRSRERAEEAAREFSGKPYGLDELRAAIPRANIVVACIDGSGGLIDITAFDQRVLAHRDRPMLVVDLSVPRAVVPDVAKLKNLLLYDLDDLEPVVEQNLERRHEASQKTADILTAELHKFLALRTYASFSPAITELRRRFEHVREEVLDQVSGETADPKSVQIAHELSKRLLDVALAQMKDGARRARSEESLDREYQRFLENL
ncbi:MAG: glutamyl-tRNA reductase [Planctomycetota bacterium]|nr:MAG: glutamyl-tRNA reductase [Planctomycetota bacterium]